MKIAFKTLVLSSLFFSVNMMFAAEPVQLTLLIDNSTNSQAVAEALISKYEEKNPNVKIELELRPGGSEGDNQVKTRLATNEMTDVFFYNSGSLFQALNPEKNIVDLSAENFIKNIKDEFIPVVSNNNKIYGVPSQTAAVGGILYNQKIYQELGLEIPKTWQQFMDNNKIIKGKGIVPVMQTFQDTWSSQIILLSDFYNVNINDPKFADNYTYNKDSFSKNAFAIRGFEKLEDLVKNEYLNEDAQSATYLEALEMIAEGQIAQYPTLTFSFTALTQDFGDKYKNVGFFALPGDTAEHNGITVWMPAALYIPKSGKNIEEAKKFLEFTLTQEACDIQTKLVSVTGPYMVKGCEMPATDFPALQQMMSYFEDQNRLSPALEFLSPIKGPSLENILVEVGTGLKTAKEGAEAYDTDVKKQAKQLGLSGW